MALHTAIRMKPPAQRQAQSKGSHHLPESTVVVSCDNHFSVGEDIWFQRFPSHLRDKAPRVWKGDGFWDMGIDGKSFYPPRVLKVLPLAEGRRGSFDLQSRLKDMADEGIDKELVYPNGVLLMLHHSDLQVREWSIRIYNEYVAELQRQAPGRFYAVGFINYWDPAKTRASIDELKALGLKTFLLPLAPKNDVEGNQIFYAADKMEYLWGAIEDSGLPIAFHIGEAAGPNARNENPIAALQNFSPFRKVVAEMIFGGILDRHPRLRMSFAEGGMNWVASVLQDAEMIHSVQHSILEWKQQHEISYYWRKHMWASFMSDAIGWRLIDLIGTDRVMWSSDYPHAESTFGFTRSSMQEVVDAVSEGDARKILGGTAIELYNF